MHRIVFWYDAPGHFADALPELSLDGVQILNMAGESTLGVKMRLELDEPEAPTLLYFPHAELASEEDWLLDTIRRYYESTLAEMRTDFVIPLTTKLASYVEKLEQDKDASTSAAEAKAIEKELSKLYKQQAELNTFDEKLRHYTDQRISLDLDDGVKVNYGKFGDLLAEVKAVTGEKAD